ncbi:TonB-dependent siderophore receptor [Pararobbsia silviterrae]|uniref:TonB-dependent siderophore receptor n=1 Tax=Pararobbsia silviterrae TaxID=1792498 RepID=A0A494Y6G7_9BURK|nr:TonB-dependent siderophore receptor [Pararobbsia silviterrae]RKP57893.1 TonB-dependent siderophore receptor [Pararobbsia silviterrae]
MVTGVRNSTAIALSLCLFNGNGIALAQSSTSGDTPASSTTPATEQLPAVVVTAPATQSTDGYVANTATTGTKTDTPIIETPQSISVVTSSQMQAQGAQTVPEALRYTSSVLSEQRGDSTAGAPYLYSRGFALDQYLDGTRLPSDSGFGYAMPSFDTYALDRIDVIHGPSSVLYGQTNPGGIANLVSKQPTTTPLHEVFFTTGSHNRLEAGFDFGGSLTADGSLSYRLTALGLDATTQVAGVRESRVLVAPAITWKPDDKTTLTVLAKYQRDPDAGYYNYLPAIGTVLPNPNGEISSHLNPGDTDYDHHTRTQYSIGYNLEHVFDSTWTVRQNVRYTVVHDDLANVFPWPTGYSDADQTTVNRYSFTNDETAKFFTIDNQAQAKFTTGPLDHTALVGIDFQRVLYNEKVGSNFFESSLNLFSPVYLPIQGATETSDDLVRMSQTGVYAQDQIAYGKWRFLVGMREDWANADDQNPVQDYTYTYSERAFTWRTGLVYLFDSGFAPYVSYSKSFDPQLGVVYGGGSLLPTYAEQYEVGLKYQPPGYNAFITAALFDLRERNVASGDPVNEGYSVEMGQVRARGLELEGHASLTNNIDLTASYTYLNDITTQSNLTASTINGESVSLQGLEPWGIPRQSASAWADYTFHDATLHGLGFGAGVRYTGTSYDESNTIKVPSRTLIDAAIHYDTGKHWLLSLNGKNLFNRTYVASCETSGICNYGDGIEVLATARYRW